MNRSGCSVKEESESESESSDSSKREFALKNTKSKFLAVMAALALTAAACGGGDSADPAEPAAPAAPAPAGQEEEASEAVGGILKVGTRDDIQRWDANRLQVILYPVHRNIYDALADYVGGLNAVPTLATGWEISDAQDSVTITLREGVTFHDGSDFTAESVAANLAQNANPDTGNQAFGPRGAVEDWEVTGPSEIVVNFKQPLAELQITDLLTSWAIGNPEYFDRNDTEANGTGPFKLDEWVPGERIVLSANTDYWGEGPFLDGYEVTIFGDADAMDAALESGAVDYIIGPRASTAARLQGQFNVISSPMGAIVDQFRINPTRPPFDNANVRLAVSYASDLDAFNDAVYEGLGIPTRLPWPTTSPAYDAELAASLEYSMERAQQLLDESGLSADQLTASYMVNSASNEAQLVGQILQASLASIGFTLEIEQVESGTFTERLLTGQFDILWGAIGNSQKYPTRVTTNSIYRVVGNPVFDIDATFPDYVAAIATANVAVTEAEQAAAFAEINRALTENMWVVSGIDRPMISLAHPDVVDSYRDIDSQARFATTRLNR